MPCLSPYLETEINKQILNNTLAELANIFLIGIHSMQDQTATMRHEVARERSTKRLKHTENLFRKNLQLKE